jgi:hypothetical protein
VTSMGQVGAPVLGDDAGFTLGAAFAVSAIS